MPPRADAPTDLPILKFADPQSWETWLDEHHGASPGIWLCLAKKASGIPSVTYGEALEVALCYGWIDCLRKSVDEVSWLQRFTPRRARSLWSKVNREKVAQLTASGRMKPAGLQVVERARQDGRWEAAYDSQRTAEVPSDF